MRIKKLQIVSLGCSKNLVDSEAIAAQIKINGVKVEYVENVTNADIVLVNTCGFISDAKEESIDVIMDCIDAKQKGFVKKVYVTGCLSQRYKDELVKSIPEVDGFYGFADLDQLFKDFGIKEKKELINERFLSTPKHYAYLKISEGCDRSCSFCAIPLIRGNHISTPIEQLVNQAKQMAISGVKELILIAQDLSYYGLDLYKEQKLASLLNELVKIEEIKWIRLHYLYPANFPVEVLKLISENDKICSYIDIPVQHISDKLLSSMKRGLDSEQTRNILNLIRSEVPNIAVRTSLIVGYPGETKKDFFELKNFIEEYKFNRLGVFTYSPEEDTKAFDLKDSVSTKEKENRRDILMELQMNISYSLNQEFVRKTLKVIVDKKEGDFYVARTEFDSPEVDNEVLIASKEKLEIGNFYNVKIISADSYELNAVYPAIDNK